LDEKIPQDSPARLVNPIGDNLDIAQINETCKGGGTRAYHLRMGSIHWQMCCFMVRLSFIMTDNRRVYVTWGICGNFFINVKKLDSERCTWSTCSSLYGVSHCVSG
jgi:hypothetical protein